VPLEVEHIVPKSRGGSDRVSNLTLSCHRCNQAKGNRTAAEFGHPEVQKQAKVPLRDAAMMNATRWALYRALLQTRLPLEVSSGGRTKWNRARLGIPKTHALDAACVGEVEALLGWQQPVLLIGCAGRGSHQRTLLNKYGFPRGYCMDHKYAHGFRTGDLVRAEVPGGKHAGVHVGRVAVRAEGSFAIKTAARKVDGISHCYCHLLQRADGYSYAFRPTPVRDANTKLDTHTKKGGRAIPLPAEPGSLLAQNL
jgi:hypothetical protein